jgi:hypothetical protein
MEGTFLFFVLTILAIILAIYFEYTTSRDTRKGGSDQRNSSDESVLSHFGSEHHGTGHPHGDAMDDDEPTQGNWLISHIKNSKVAAIFSENILCRIGIHQGTWTTEDGSGCLQRRFCMYCGIPQQRGRHIWPNHHGYRYFNDGSCELVATCFRCGKTKFTGVQHEGRISYWNAHCKRCGEYLHGDYGDGGDGGHSGHGGHGGHSGGGHGGGGHGGGGHG